MISDKDIKALLKVYVAKGIKQFAIYPFGVNGVNVKNILQDYFDISPIQIVDNEYSKFNSKICDFQTFEEKYDSNTYVILTIENKILNCEMKEALAKFVAESQIINLIDCDGLEDNIHKFFIDDFLPEIVDKKLVDLDTRQNEKHERIKVRILYQSKSIWNAIKTIWSAFQEDSSCDTLILHGYFIDRKMQENFDSLGIKCVKIEDYCVQEDRPDVLIIASPYDNISQIDREYCKLIVAASMQLVRYSNNMKEFWKLQKRGFGRFQPDYFLFDSLLYREIMESEYASPKIIEMGNAKFDGIYEACKNKQYKPGWEKLKGKKVILWATDHGIGDGMVAKHLTFDLYAKTIFQYAKDNQDVGIIFRPHPTFINELLNNLLWSRADLEGLRKYCEQSPNIIFDDSLTYDSAYSIADGILTDAFCGMTCSALPTLKPICLTYRNVGDMTYHEELAKCYDSAYCQEDIISFMDKIKNDQDTTLDLRKEACEKYIKHFDGKNGWRIKEFIKQKYLEQFS